MLPIERSSFILLSQQPAADWVNGLPTPEGHAEEEPVTAEMLNAQPPIFLTELFESPDAMDESFKNHWARIWESWLTSWTPEKEMWPKERTLESFGQWFQVLPTPMVFDALTQMPGEIAKPHSGIILP